MKKEPPELRFRDWVIENELKFYALVAGLGIVILYLAEATQVYWLYGMGTAITLIFGLVAAGGYLFRRFKKWRYTETADIYE